MPTVAEALQIGWTRHQAGDVAIAEQTYRQVLQVAPGNANAWCFLGMACHDQGRYQEAAEAYYAALRVKADFPVALNNLGNTLKQLGRLDEAVARCREALRYKPDYGTAYNNLGVALVAQGQLTDAAVAFRQALDLMPNDAVARTNLGAALVSQGDFDEGTSSARRAIDINPNYAEAHKNLAIVSLLFGDFENGWQEYEWRWKCPGARPPNVAQPRWDGASLAGRTIVVTVEQGLGDTIHFVRYAKILQSQGARVVLSCQKALLPLLADCEGVGQLLPQDAPLPPYDVYIPLLSIPGVLQTRLETIPADVPYLRAKAELVERWRETLEEFPGFRIGIAWQGSPDFHADRQRSIPLSSFAPLAGLPGVRLFSLQKGDGAEQVKDLEGAFSIVDFGDVLDGESGPFMDTAALMMNLDLVISSCTSVVHLAGALGVPVWVALAKSPDWRWLLDRNDSPWYPTARLFRQQELGAWDEVFARIAGEVRRRLPSPQERPDEIASSPPQEFNQLVQSRHGRMLYNCHDIYIGRSLQLYGEYSEAEIELLLPYLDAGNTVVEAGANVGAHTLPLAQRIGPAGRVYAFEPQRIIFQTLCANVALNSLTNVVCRNAAVGDAAGELFVPDLDYAAENNFGGLGLGGFAKGERVPVARLDSLELAECHLIKVDVEGMEIQTLQGAAETVARCRPIVYVENDRAENSSTLIALLFEWGYRLYWHLPPLYRANNFFRHEENVFDSIVSVNMLGLPDEGKAAAPPLPAILDPHSNWQDYNG